MAPTSWAPTAGAAAWQTQAVAHGLAGRWRWLDPAGALFGVGLEGRVVHSERPVDVMPQVRSDTLPRQLLADEP
jgi:hypothetical protein